MSRIPPPMARKPSGLKPPSFVTATTATLPTTRLHRAASTASESEALPKLARLPARGRTSSMIPIPPVASKLTPTKRSSPMPSRSDNQQSLTMDDQPHNEPSLPAAISRLAEAPTSTTKTDNIRVLLRIRPSRSDSEGGGLVDTDEDSSDNQLSVSRGCLDVNPDGASVTIAPATTHEKRFAFDRVFDPMCSQEDIFQDAGLMAVENALNGFNGCIFAYGQTGSGKTFTMLGGGPGGSAQADVHALKVSPLRGLMPRIFDHIFRRLDELVADDSNDLEYSLACSYLEIYNEKVFDLLEVGPAAQHPKTVREDSNKKEVYVDQLRQIPIQTVGEAIELLQVGSRNRRMASTDMNRESSRSHAVFTLRLVQTHHTERGALITRRSNLHLVDLAGSEKQRQTRVAGQRLKEAAQINKSLSALGNVIMALVDVSNGLKRHVHYRDSKLTFLLRDSLGGNSITTVIATISGEEKYFSETLSTLKFAQRAKFIKNNAVQNEDSDAIIPLLKQEIDRLRQEIDDMRKQTPSSQEMVLRMEKVSEFVNRSHLVNPRQNRWEPALEVMERLLRASGIEESDVKQMDDLENVLLRCQRLEMLLYRMICRYEEQKVRTFSNSRYTSHPKLHSDTSRQSMLRAPKFRFNGDIARSDVTNGITEIDNTGVESELADQVRRGDELETENNVLRLQLCEFLEWKSTIVDEERRLAQSGVPMQISSSEAGGNPSIPGFHQANCKTSLQVDDHRDRNEELVETLEAYRSFFSDLCGLLEEKDYEPPRSPTASVSTFTEDNSISGRSLGDEDSESVISEDTAANGDFEEDALETQREIRRVQNVAIRLDRKMEKYKDALQQLEGKVASVQDELETATAATKFAEFQLSQLRDATTSQAETQHELSRCRSDLRRQTEHNQHLSSRVIELEHELADAVSQAKQSAYERDQMKALYGEQRHVTESPSMASRSHFQDTQTVEDPVIRQMRESCMISETRDQISELELELNRTKLSPALSPVSTLQGISRYGAADFCRNDGTRVRVESFASDLSSSGFLVMPSNASDCSQLESQQHLQRVLQDVLSDNADLIKTIRDFEDEKRIREHEHSKESARLREENESLRKRVQELRSLALLSPAPLKQPDDVKALVKRLRGERSALQLRLNQEQTKVRSLEDEITRYQTEQATRRSIASDFFEM